MAGLLSMKEALELAVLRDVMEKRLTLEEACERLKIERTTLWRRRKRFAESGAKGLAHRLRGRVGNRKADAKVREAVCKLYSNEYQAHGFNVTHFYEQAHKDFPKSVSYSAVWRWLRAENLVTPRRRGRRHHSRRPRKEAFGEMLQMDTSIHDWFRTGEKQCLIAVMDDATNHICGALLTTGDTTLANMAVLKGAFERYGLPMSLYTDRSPVFKFTRTGIGRVRRPGYAYPFVTRVEQALDKLGVEHIHAYTPQAKGRIERSFGVWQDRLVAELSKAGIKTLEAANTYIRKTFVPHFNKQFAAPIAKFPSSFVQLEDNVSKLNFILAEHYPLTVSNDHVVSSKSASFKVKIVPSGGRVSYAKAKVDLYKHTDGNFSLLYKNERLKFKEVA